MAYVVLVLTVVIVFTVGFMVGVLIVGAVRHWLGGRNRRDTDRKSERRP